METKHGATQENERVQQEHRDDDRRKPAFQPVRDQIDGIMLEVRNGKIGGDLPDKNRAAHEVQIESGRWTGRAFWLRAVGVVSAIGAAATVWKFVLP